MRKLLIAFPILMLFSSISFSQNNDKMKYNTDLYEKEWAAIQAFENQGLPKSAFSEIEKLLSKAQTENNPAQVVKCILKKEEFQVQIEEKGNVHSFYRLKKYISDAQSPVKEVLLSATASLLEQYYQENQWKINSRTNVVGVENDSIDTWSPAKYISTINELYLASVKDAKLLQSIDIEYFKIMLQGGDDESTLLRPTLYDLLAHRALDHFMNDQSNLVEAVYKFEMRDISLLSSELNLSKNDEKDETSYKYQSLLLFENLEKFHSQDKDASAYLDVLQKRLSYVYQNIINKEKDKSYLAALQETSKKYVNNSMSSEFKNLEATYFYEKAGFYESNNPNDERRLYYAKALEICKETIAKFPNSRGAKGCQVLENSIKAKSFNCTIERVNIPNQAALALINYKNVDLINAKLLKINAKERIDIEEIQANGYRDGVDPNQKLVSYLNSLIALRSWKIDLPKTDDYRSHSTETIINNPLPVGEYIILLSENEQFTSSNTQYANLAFSNISYLVRDIKGEKEVMVLNRESGEPMKGVIAEIFTQEYSEAQNRYIKKKVGNALSDNNGFMYPKVKEGQSYSLRFSKGKDTLFSDESYYQYRDRSQENEYNQTIFFMDRAIYRPGQTVYFKGLALHFDKKRLPTVLKNQEVRVAFFDANHQEISHLELKTNDYGTFNGEFKALMSGLTGNMHIKSNIGGNAQYFRVEEYKRPKFETVFKPIEGSFKLNEEITVTGHAKAFAGSNVDGAKVRYRVIRNIVYPYWGYRCWWRPMPQSGGMEIINGKTTTDANGEFKVTFKAIPDESAEFQNQPQFNYEIKADVVDINGETHSAETNVSVGSVAINVSLGIENQNDIRNFKKIQIISTNLSNQKEPISGSLKIALLTSPTTLYKARKWDVPDLYSINEADFRKAFPTLPYKNEDKVQNWAIKRELFNGTVDNTKINDLDVSKMAWESGNYVAILNTKDKYGTPIEVKEYFTVYDIKSKVVPANTPYFSVVEKATYEPNDTAKVFIGTAGDKLKVLVELERNGKIEISKWLNIKNLHNVNFKIQEADRGDIQCHLTFVKNNRFYRETQTINVPWSNKDLKIEYQTFRDKLLPGAQEEWRIKISGPKKEKVAAEMVAAMYDASLDQLAKNAWYLNIYPQSYSRIGFNSNWSFENESARVLIYERSDFDFDNNAKNYWQLIEPNIYFGYQRVMYDMMPATMSSEKAGGAMPRDSRNDDVAVKTKAMAFKAEIDNDGVYEQKKDGFLDKEEQDPKTKKQDIQPRTNLKETVFFIPNLMTDAEGNVIIKFTMNEALTKWKFLGMAHTQDLKFALTEKEIVTQKELMVIPNAPRFMREGDTFEFTAKVSNLSAKTLNGTAILELFDAITNQPVDAEMSNTTQNQAFSVNTGQSARLAWRLKVPFGKINALTWRITAKNSPLSEGSGEAPFSDGEENSLPVLTNRMLVTETKPLPVRANKSKEFTFDAMDKALKSNTLQTHKLTLEFTSNPAWYAVQALPYMMEYPYECTEQVFSRFYANSLATSVTNAHPNVKRVFDKWKNEQPNALLSNLNKNQELKYAILEETPWVMAACNESQQKQNIALLFDLNRMSDEANRAIDKLVERQMPSGGFSWFPGGHESWYITQYLVEGMGHLKKLEVKIDNNKKISTLIQKALPYIDREFLDNYNRLKVNVEKGYSKWEYDNLDGMALHYLYARSFFPENQMNTDVKKAADYYLGQAEKYWTKRGIYEQGLITLALDRNKKGETTSKIIKSLKERALNNDEMGMYWKQEYGYYWNELPIETQALMIEVFKDVAKDGVAVDDLKTWLLKNKQTNQWKTTKATASAVYALLMSGSNWLTESKDVKISFSGKDFDLSKIEKEEGTGHFKSELIVNRQSSIVNDYAKIKVENPNNVVAWGAIYWQYFEDLDKIKEFKDTPLKLVKQLFKEENTDKGPIIKPVTAETKLQPGDKLKVRIELRVDRNMEYVHMKDTRASGFEPINVLSQYKWQGGLGYYESTRDAATNFFFDYLPKGTYVFEYPMFVNHNGDFSNGITTIQCMYAPEFTSHSEGLRVKVGE